jgi:4-amino-4-deoxy-L-arabinose transferase-like glycosyltransferase
MRWSVLILVALLILDVWYRAHTFGPTVVQATGVDVWPKTVGPSEPLDCDEAAYAYIGHRLLRGDVMYRELTENKPPLGYWLYALGVAFGGYEELAIRLLPVPAVLLTIVLLWWIAKVAAGPAAACLAAGFYVLLSTDPYLFGNGSNMEHFMNLFSTASLALVIRGRSRGARWPLAAAGACLGAATLVKQVAIVPGAIYAAALLSGRLGGPDTSKTPWGIRLRDMLDLGLGFAAVVGLAAIILVAQGAGPAAYVDIMRYGRALATDTLPEPNAPPALIRWLTGNADPSGKFPWPFGSTNYLVWWGTGSWPIWLAAVPCLLYLIAVPGTTAIRQLVAGWTIATVLEVVLPGLYWQHYYLLPTPGVALVVAITLADAIRGLRGGTGRRPWHRVIPAASALALIAAVGWTVLIQLRCYLLVPPQELTVRYKGGGQWVALRSLGRDLARRSAEWKDPHLYIWGWQSPLHFYGKLDGATRHFFVDNLLRDQAERDHPLIKPRIAEIMRDLRSHPPELIFVGYPPFPELRGFLQDRYLPSRLVPAPSGMGLWIERGHYAAFESVPRAPGPT